ncbi:MAG: DUF460 domain-containing protein [Candidatus Heimdallarchaeota archaeon]|nr:DUF460 domain-containing protein [Candidatus Heimdallarchaeota archaeon]MCK5049129.1 DUF460 domain-containing protein [Candidatus Heimdallarchaeota archaeon]
MDKESSDQEIVPEKTIIGIDIAERSSGHLRYAVFIINESGDELALYPLVGHKRLMKYVRKYKPSYLACDNVMELVPSAKDIAPFCSSLPPETQLVQVTAISNSQFRPLSSLMRQNKIRFTGRLNPVESAKGCAFLALKRVGCVLQPFEDEALIKVSRSRSKGPGGWSQQRYSRSMDIAVQGVFRTILQRLEEKGFELDSSTNPAKHGLKQGFLHVYEPFSEVSKIVKRGTWGNAQVTLSRPNRDSLVYIPLQPADIITTPSVRHIRRLIVGVDPGTTVGIAMLDLRGNLVALESLRNLGRGAIIKTIVKQGLAVLIASDVKPMPKAVHKISSVLEAQRYTPQKDILVSRKNEIASLFDQEHGKKPANAHERDALSAAYSAYRLYESLLKQVEEPSYDLSFKEASMAQGLIIRGFSIQEAVQTIYSSRISSIEEEEEETIDTEDPVFLKEQLIATNKRILRLDREITRAEAQIANQTMYNAELLEKQDELVDRLDSLEKSMGEEKRNYRAELLKDRKYRLLERDVSFLRSQLMEERALSLKLRGEVTELKQAIWLEARSGYYPVKVIKKFSRNDIVYTQDKLGLAVGDIVLVVDGSGAGPKTAELLIEAQIKAVIIQKGTVPQAAAKELIEARIPLFYAEEGILRIGDVALIAIDVLNDRLEHAELEVDEYHLTKAQSNIAKIVHEHRDDGKNDL